MTARESAGSMVRVAAVGDVHIDQDVVGRYRPALEQLGERADLLLLAGDLTRHGTVAEAACVAREFGGLPVPVIAVLGNHDYHCDEVPGVTSTLRDAGIIVLECQTALLEIDRVRLAVVGAKGFGGGFAGRNASNFGEPEMKAFVRTTCEVADRLGEGLRAAAECHTPAEAGSAGAADCQTLAGAGSASVAGCDVLVALTHYSPVPDTLVGEPLEIYPFLGSYLLAQAIDSAPTTLAVHGHAHRGSERGMTPGGVRVRNVAHPVIKQAYSVFHLTARTSPAMA